MFKDKNPVGLSFNIYHDSVVFKFTSYLRAEPLYCKRMEGSAVHRAGVRK